MKNIAIIPARSGSKGIKDKNIKLLNNKPLLAYTIEAAIKSEIFDEIMVSTDSEKYATIGKQYGANVPFLREDKLSGDNASSWDVVKDTLWKYKQVDIKFDNVVLLQPTSPLRDYQDIIDSYSLFINKNANTVVSVCEMEHSPLWSNTIPADLSMEKFFKSNYSMINRQKINTFYRINGAIYIVNINYLLNNNDIYSKKSFAYLMPKNKSIDIDDDFDFELAKYFINSK
ncbi:acylneuraminate cytidylyltransferase family protein [bacterium]|nr:acylneuraminate cytidylyltransferase family protein [bacterium]